MGWRKGILVAMAMSLLAISSDAGTAAKAEGGTIELSVEIYDGYLIIAKIEVGELHELRFLLDTGTSTTAIDRRLAKRLGVVGQPAEVINFDKAVSVEWGEVTKIAYGPEEASNARVLIEDLRYLRPGGAPVDGILGLDLLRRKNFLVDYSRKRVVFGTTESYGMRVAPMRTGGTEVCVEAELDGQLVWMIADTGMAGTVLYQRGLPSTVGRYAASGQETNRSLGGLVESRQSVVSQFKVGGQNLERHVQLVNAPKVKRLDGIAGYLGPAMLDAKQIVFDFEGHQLRWRK